MNLKSLVLAAALAVAPMASHATVLFSQDFSSSLGANEALAGNFAVADGKMGHVTGSYGANDTSSYTLRMDLAGLTDGLFSFDWASDSELNWDGWNVQIVPVGQGYDDLHPAEGTPRFYNRFVAALHGPGLTGDGQGHAVFDLKPFVGQAVNIKLQFASDGSINGRGVLFDNLLVTGTPIPDMPPGGAVPEPTTWALMLTGFLGAGSALRRRRAHPDLLLSQARSAQGEAG